MKIEDLRKAIEYDKLKDFQKGKDSFEDDFLFELKEELENDTSKIKKHTYRIMLWVKKKGYLSHLIYFSYKFVDLIYLIEENLGLDSEDEKNGHRNRMIISFLVGFLIPSFVGLLVLLFKKMV